MTSKINHISGYGSFCMPITISFAGTKQEFTVRYDLNLSLGIILSKFEGIIRSKIY